MDRAILKSFYVVLVSLFLAIIFNVLFFEKHIGISFFIFIGIILGVVSLLLWYKRERTQRAWWIVLLIIFFALMPGIRANDFLNFLNVCTTLGLLMVLAHEITGTPIFLMKLRDYVILVLLTPFRMLRRAASTFFVLGQVHSSVQHRDTWLRVGKGIIMAVPVLIIFGVLFSQADLVFSQFIRSFIHVTISPHTIQYLVVLLFAFVASLGFLSYIFFQADNKPLAPHEQTPSAQSNKGIEVLVFLGLIAALFLLFIGFQITYLFGGETNIIHAGFTYAEYARRGFWELLVVAMLSLLVLLVSEKYGGFALKKEKRFLIPAGILIVEVAVIIVSAFKRLSLYINTYGMTTLRFYVAGFIILLLLVFILLAVKFILSKQEHFFAFNAFLLVIAFLITINIINPDAFIAASNIRQYSKTGVVDIYYVAELSTDAEAEKIALYNTLEKGNDENKQVFRQLLLNEQKYLQVNNIPWQSANVSRSQALKVLSEF